MTPVRCITPSLEHLMDQVETAIDEVRLIDPECPILGIWYGETEDDRNGTSARLWDEYFPALSAAEKAQPTPIQVYAFFERVLEELQRVAQHGVMTATV